MVASWLSPLVSMRGFMAVATVGLLATGWLPWSAARATAAAESRAQECVLLLAAAAAEVRPDAAPPDGDLLYARFVRLALRSGLDPTRFERLDPLPDTWLVLADGDYLYHVAASPPDAREIVASDTVHAIEVAAWPRDDRSAGNTAFFVPDDALAAATRNLNKGYRGSAERRLPPGRAQRRPGGLLEKTRSYRGHDDERWIVF